MNSVTFYDEFSSIDSYKDLGLLLIPRKIPKPTPKTNYVDIPGGDGSLDLSEVVAEEIKYNDYVIPFEFHVIDEKLDWDSKVSEIANRLNGKKKNIIISSDSDYYYVGVRCEISEFSSNKRLGNIAINCRVKPYKLKRIKSSYSFDLGNTKTTKEIRINNDRMTTLPSIICSESVNVTFNGNTYVLNAGTHEILDILFKEGLNILTVEGTGTFTLNYQEGSL